jgi:hypothetical protein
VCVCVCVCVCVNVCLWVCPDPADILEAIPLYLLPSLPDHRHPTDTSPPVALLSAKECAKPSSYADALSGPQATDRNAAMRHEVDSLLENITRTVVDLPP